ncbi:hypothetical protein BHE74_00046344 [Ensete ventricosum]|nr:hypothetical protein BHE74_00046344 [Ensete ventricosum]
MLSELSAPIPCESCNNISENHRLREPSAEPARGSLTYLSRPSVRPPRRGSRPEYGNASARSTATKRVLLRI